jgi:hypothetical protein
MQVKSVVCLTDATARYDPKPLAVLRAAKFTDLYGERDPEEPAREQSASETSSRRSSRNSSSAKALSFIAWAAPAGPAPS